MTTDALMEARRRYNNPAYSVVLGLCPGCDRWQVDYTDAVVEQFAQIVARDGRPEVDLSVWYETLEDALQEHLRECPPLQVVVASL